MGRNRTERRVQREITVSKNNLEIIALIGENAEQSRMELVFLAFYL
jgi:hypothetical protein